MTSAAIDRVPTLTEVVEWRSMEPEMGRASPAPVVIATAPTPMAAEASGQVQVSDLSANLLFELEARVNLALESRLRTALTPVLARAADAMIREAQQELAVTLRELVEEAVTRAIERHTNL